MKLAWTQGKGIKESPIASAIWIEEDGVTYIPWDSLPHDLKTISVGGWIDEDTLPPSKSQCLTFNVELCIVFDSLESYGHSFEYINFFKTSKHFSYTKLVNFRSN